MNRLFLILLLPFVLLSCKADFSPNADWKEVPSVYCVLDQDDSISYVRVQKCYLGSGNLKGYSQVADSTNYAAGELSVKILVWGSASDMARDGAIPLRTLNFDYTVLDDKSEGSFASPQQPVYCHVNAAGDLDPDNYYQLIVRKSATGQVIARSSTWLIGDAQHDPWIDRPHPTIYGRSISFRRQASCQIEWYAFPQGRCYQFDIRYYYRNFYLEPDSLRWVDMSLPVITSNLNERTLTTNLALSTFLAEIEHALANDTNTKVFVDSALVSLAVCNEPLNAYLNSIDMIKYASSQEQQLYSNIEGGVGVFGSRRAHLKLLVPTDNSDMPPMGLRYQIAQLGVGFN